MNIKITKTNFIGFGAKITPEGVYFAVTMNYFYKGGIYFYDKKSLKIKYTIDFCEDYSYGNVYCVLISGLNIEKLAYRYFSDEDIFTDPYTKAFLGLNEYGKAVSESDLYSLVDNSSFKSILENDKKPHIGYEEAILYLTHVRGATMLDSKVKNMGTFAGLREKIPYYRDLGITSLLLMPSYEFIECKASDERNNVVSDYRINPDAPVKTNYWGFAPGFYFAPKSGYSKNTNANEEFAELICALHKENMELIMMMYFDETASSDIVVDSLRYFATDFHVDGFRITGTGIDIVRIVNDPFLKDTKLLFDNVDLNCFKPGSKTKYKNLGLYSSMYPDMARGFLKGDEDKVRYMSFAIRENSKNYAPIRYITDYHGFSLMDLVSFNRKHNEANGEDNTDGNDYNYSWNCGVEGETKKTGINKLRFRQAMNGMLLTLLCQGTPQIKAGDELLNTCGGNNNPWCQDNEIAWISYKKTKQSKEFYDFVKNVIAFRKRHVILHQPGELKLVDYISCKLPDVSFHGEEAYRMCQEPVSREFGILYAGDYAKQYKGEPEDSVYIVYNFHWDDKIFALPVCQNDSKWHLLFSTDGSTDMDFNEEKAKLYTDKEYVAKGRSVSIFLLKADK